MCPCLRVRAGCALEGDEEGRKKRSEVRKCQAQNCEAAAILAEQSFFFVAVPTRCAKRQLAAGHDSYSVRSQTPYIDLLVRDDLLAVDIVLGAAYVPLVALIGRAHQDAPGC